MNGHPFLSRAERGAALAERLDRSLGVVGARERTCVAHALSTSAQHRTPVAESTWNSYTRAWFCILSLRTLVNFF